MLHLLITTLKATWISHQMVTQPWLWAICETLHFVGLALLIGGAGLFDLRLMGFLRGIPVAAVMPVRRWAAAGVLINLVTGLMFFAGAPDQYVENPAWWGKLAFLAIAMLNILFETRLGSRMLELEDGRETPLAFKVAGGVSIGSWFLVLYFGRMLPFIGNAF